MIPVDVEKSLSFLLFPHRLFSHAHALFAIEATVIPRVRFIAGHVLGRNRYICFVFVVLAIICVAVANAVAAVVAAAVTVAAVVAAAVTVAAVVAVAATACVHDGPRYEHGIQKTSHCFGVIYALRPLPAFENHTTRRVSPFFTRVLVISMRLTIIALVFGVALLAWVFMMAGSSKKATDRAYAERFTTDADKQKMYSSEIMDIYNKLYGQYPQTEVLVHYRDSAMKNNLSVEELKSRIKVDGGTPPGMDSMPSPSAEKVIDKMTQATGPGTGPGSGPSQVPGSTQLPSPPDVPAQLASIAAQIAQLADQIRAAQPAVGTPGIPAMPTGPTVIATPTTYVPNSVTSPTSVMQPSPPPQQPQSPEHWTAPRGFESFISF